MCFSWLTIPLLIWSLNLLLFPLKTVEAERISVDHVAHLKPSDGGSAATQCKSSPSPVWVWSLIVSFTCFLSYMSLNPTAFQSWYETKKYGNSNNPVSWYSLRCDRIIFVNLLEQPQTSYGILMKLTSLEKNNIFGLRFFVQWLLISQACTVPSRC